MERMQYCDDQGHDGCSFDIARQNEFDVQDDLSGKQLVYGTSDPHINPGELLATVRAAKRAGSTEPVVFMYYPRGAAGLRDALDVVYNPHGDEMPENPNELLELMGLTKEDVTIMRFQDAFNEQLKAMTLNNFGRQIRKYRKEQAFVVLTQEEDGRRVRLSRKGDKVWKNVWQSVTLGDALERTDIKLSGTMLYAGYGNFVNSAPNLVGLLPHNEKGDVYGSFAMGARSSALSTPVKVFPVGGIDSMTTEQFEMFQEDKRWRVAPASVIMGMLEDPAFMEEFDRRMFVDKTYAPVLYNTETRTYSFFDQ